MIYANMPAFVGNTPLVHLANFTKANAINAMLCAKIEWMNPSGSVKDRAAKALLDDAEERGAIKPGGIIIEPTSGNTGIGLAAEAAARGYKAIFTMPESMSIERRRLMAAYGAEIVLTEAAKGIAGAVEKAKELLAATENAYMPGQFDNPANPAVHYKTTGPELWRDTDGKIDAFIAGVGTGGTISGTGKYLKEQNAAVHIVAVQPAKSPLLTGGKPGPHGLQGIGPNFIPQTLDTQIFDEVISVTEDDAYAAARSIAHTEGLLCGVSSGAALAAAMLYAKRPENAGKMICVLLPDSGERYLSLLAEKA